ncbi:hypothetical protein WJX84_009101 [Apatococcus fuscideae]|uniref:Uncharacterized protein n=1 Tax=Apatococcus fuscideae TaxID=2026836 RepID=A0AAW1T354_9CHLO
MVPFLNGEEASVTPESSSGRRKRPRPLLQQVGDSNSAGDSKFARALGSVDVQTRNQGLQALATWLSRREAVSEAEMSKIWKGLFYCFWHSDKQPVQKHLAERLAEILGTLQPEVAIMYFRMFLKTMQREWFGIDRLRLDKFMLLVRCFLRQAAARLCASNWDTSTVEAQAACLSEEVLGKGGSATNLAAGLGYHLADVFLLETMAACEDCGKMAGGRPSHEGLQAWLEPFCQTLAASNRAAFLPRLQDGVFDKLMRSVRDGDLWIQHLDIAALAAHLFHLGAQPGVRTRNRSVLYELNGQLLKSSSKRPRPSSSPPAPAANAALQPSAEESGVQRLQRAASLEQEAAMATGGSDAEAVQDAKAAGVSLRGSLHSPSTSAATPPATSQAAPADGSPDTALRKKLRFSLQRNLYHASKSPAPPAEIRTPPNLQPKGPAIKKSATIGVMSRKKSRLGPSAPAAATAVKKGQRQKKQLWK